MQILDHYKERDQHMVVTDYEKDEADNVYFNIEIRPTNETLGDPALYDVQRTIPLIADASKYYASIIRFNIPNFFVPIHIMPIQDDQGDVNLSEYSVTLEYDGDVQQVFLEYVPSGDFVVPPPPSSNPSGKQTDSPYYWIFEYCKMVFMVNTALSTAFSNLASVPPTISGNPPAPPVMTFNPITNLFNILVQKDYYDKDIGGAGPIKVYLNGKLWTIFNGFCINQVNVSVGGASSISNFSPDGRDWVEQYIVKK